MGPQQRLPRPTSQTREVAMKTLQPISFTLDSVHSSLAPKIQVSSYRRQSLAFFYPSSHHTAIRTMHDTPRSHCPQQGAFEYDHGDKPYSIPLPCILKEKEPSDSLPLFPVCKERFGRFTGSCETVCLAQSHLDSNLHVPGCHPQSVPDKACRGLLEMCTTA